MCKTQRAYTPRAQGESVLPRTPCYLPKINQVQCKHRLAGEETCKQNRLPVAFKDTKTMFKEGGTNLRILKQGSGIRGEQVIPRNLRFSGTRKKPGWKRCLLTRGCAADTCLTLRSIGQDPAWQLFKRLIGWIQPALRGFLVHKKLLDMPAHSGLTQLIKN